MPTLSEVNDWLSKLRCRYTILLKSYILKISRLILQILVMSLSSFICRNLKRRSFTMSYFERSMSIRIKYCSCINFYVCLGYCKLCFGSVSSSVFFQLILLVLEWEGGGAKMKVRPGHHFRKGRLWASLPCCACISTRHVDRDLKYHPSLQNYKTTINIYQNFQPHPSPLATSLHLESDIQIGW